MYITIEAELKNIRIFSDIIENRVQGLFVLVMIEIYLIFCI